MADTGPFSLKTRLKTQADFAEATELPRRW